MANLERLGIVEQIPDPSDARAELVRYTRYGRAGYQRATAVFTELEHELAARVGPTRVASPGRSGRDRQSPDLTRDPTGLMDSVA